MGKPFAVLLGYGHRDWLRAQCVPWASVVCAMFSVIHYGEDVYARSYTS